MTRSSVPDTIFSNKQQATSNKQQATSNKQQATSNKQQATSNKQQATSNKQQATSNKQQATSGIRTGSAQTNSQLNTNFLTAPRTHKSESPSLCVFYIIHLIKPQGTQSVEFRSTLQRIIKEDSLSVLGG
ncbi:hypothetical protein HMPREF9353_00430 [Treponema denticola F0402]|nr:hypothetical protein HMPREF9353_00430 [Treponema denticola F0402]